MIFAKTNQFQTSSYRSNHAQMLCEKVVFEKFAKFTEKYLYQSFKVTLWLLVKWELCEKINCFLLSPCKTSLFPEKLKRMHHLKHKKSSTFYTRCTSLRNFGQIRWLKSFCKFRNTCLHRFFVFLDNRENIIIAFILYNDYVEFLLIQQLIF